MGAAYVFSAVNGLWGYGVAYLNAKLIPSDNNTNQFGGSVSISGDAGTIAAGASGLIGFISSGPGVVYVFTRPGTSWSSSIPQIEAAKLIASDATTDDYFGASVATNGDGSVIAAAPGNGPAYVFVRPASGWINATETAKLAPPDRAYSVSTSSNASTIIIGAPDATLGPNTYEGAAYVFTGSAAAPAASISTSSLTFGNQAIGTTSGTQTVTVTNTGSGSLHVTSVAVTRPFTTTQNCVSASPIAPGSSCSENVSFATLSAGPITGTLTFTDDSGGASGATQQVQLRAMV